MPVRASSEQEKYIRQYARMIAEMACQRLYRYWVPRHEMNEYHQLKDCFGEYYGAEKAHRKAMRGHNKKLQADTRRNMEACLERCRRFYRRKWIDDE